MDHKKSPIRRQKRTSKVLEDNFWDCSVCTYRNTAEAFKCSMCDVRKGTSTRKPRLNPALAAQQAATLPGASNAANAGPSGSSPMTNGGSASTAATASGSGSSSTSNHSSNSNPHTNHHSNVAGSSSGGSSASSHHNHGHHPKPPKVSRSKTKHKKYPARLTNVDRSTAQTREVTVNSVTVVITEYKPKAAKQPPSRRESSEQSMSESNDSRS